MLTDKSVVNKIAAQINSGYWEVDQKYFFNKAECLRYASRIKTRDVQYHFFDEIFTASDWSVEPSESLDELYAERARQIRDKYDYIMLSISGGSDSMNMLYAFLNNGLKVDEIVTFYPVTAIEKLLPTFDFDESNKVNVMFEYNMAFLPQIEKISKSHPNIKITILDHTDSVINTIGGSNAHKFDMAGLTMGPGAAGPLMVVDHQRKLNKPNSAIITGIDKPRVVYSPELNKFATYFQDFHSLWGGVSKDTYSGFKPTVEYFYYAYEFPKILKKQSYEIKKAMTPFVRAEPGSTVPDYSTLHNRWRAWPYDIFIVQHPFFEKLLYPTNFNPSIFQAAKPSSMFFAEANNWFTHSHLTDERVKSYYEGQIAEFVAGIDKHFLYHVEGGKIGGFAPIGSRLMYLT
jgi:hypothetical protein